MSTREGLATALESVVGADHLLSTAAAAAYAVDGVPPTVVVCPADEEQVAAVMRLAAEHQATVFPRGGGSHMTLGHTPERVDIVLSLRRLQQQLAYEPADLTTTVQAGMRLADLQQTLHEQGQFLALDPPAAATTTLGGSIATNMSGPRRLLYGSARDILATVEEWSDVTSAYYFALRLRQPGGPSQQQTLEAIARFGSEVIGRV